MRRAVTWLWGLSVLGMLGLAACATDDPGTGGQGGKTDLPTDTPTDSCTKRKADALEGNVSMFASDAIRWACADVEGVNTNNQDDRGQEYCEYFAVLQLPPEVEGGDAPAPITPGRITSVETSDIGQQYVTTDSPGVELTDDQIFFMEDYPSEVVGQCVFTSWHMDIMPEVPACESADGCPTVQGVPVTGETFRMRLPANANEAASALVADCMNGTPSYGDAEDAEDPLHSDFYRGCLMVSELYGTEWRRSDPAVCAAAMRLTECGCGLPEGGHVPTALIPAQPVTDTEGNESITLRGFPLGGWAGLDTVPPGCRQVELGDNSQTIVTCDLTGADVLNGATDLKRKCTEKYGKDVVVYVPIPQGALTCSGGDGPYADTCSAEPWVVTQ